MTDRKSLPDGAKAGSSAAFVPSGIPSSEEAPPGQPSILASSGPAAEPQADTSLGPPSLSDLDDLLPDPLPIPPRWACAPPLPHWRDGEPVPRECAGIDPLPEALGNRRRTRQPAARPRGPDFAHLRKLAAGRAAELAAKLPPVQKSKVSPERSLKRGTHLLERYRWVQDLVRLPTDEIEPLEFANYALSLKPDLSSGAWREYREAAKRVIKTIPHQNMEIALAMLESDVAYSVDELASRRPNVDRDLPPTRISRKHFDKIIKDAPSHSRSALLPAMADWIVATAHTGIATHWQTTDIEEYHDPADPTRRRRFLHVVHPNCAAGSSPWMRTLDLSDFSPDTWDAIRRHVDRAHRWTHAGEYRYQQTQIFQLLRSVCKTLFRTKQPYSIQTMRYQFISNMESVCPSAVAALIGDIPVEIVPTAYANSRQAWLKHEILAVPVPDESSVAIMSRRIAYRRARNAAEMARSNLAKIQRGTCQATNE